MTSMIANVYKKVAQDDDLQERERVQVLGIKLRSELSGFIKGDYDQFVEMVNGIDSFTYNLSYSSGSMVGSEVVDSDRYSEMDGSGYYFQMQNAEWARDATDIQRSYLLVPDDFAEEGAKPFILVQSNTGEESKVIAECANIDELGAAFTNWFFGKLGVEDKTKLKIAIEKKYPQGIPSKDPIIPVAPVMIGGKMELF